MPMLQVNDMGEQCQWGLWQITETIPDLSRELRANPHDWEYFYSITHPGKLLQTMAARLLVQQMLFRWDLAYQGIVKDAHGRPSLAAHSLQVAISHTNGFAAAILHQHKQVGIDVELIREKLQKVAKKYLSYDELIHTGNRLDKLCVYWCAKEALYKMGNQPHLSFKEQIQLQNFDLNTRGTVQGHVIRSDTFEPVNVHYEFFLDFVVAYSYAY